jgi:hypothetical protein
MAAEDPTPNISFLIRSGYFSTQGLATAN